MNQRMRSYNSVTCKITLQKRNHERGQRSSGRRQPRGRGLKGVCQAEQSPFPVWQRMNEMPTGIFAETRPAGTVTSGKPAAEAM